MADNDIVLSVKNVSKCFEMYEKPVHRLYQTLCAGKKKFYKEFWALKDISFDVHRGECVGIIGRNGAGKSTLLQIITGTLAPTAGEVKVNGRIAALLELGSGFNMEFTGRENVLLNATILGLTQEEIGKRYQDIVEFADIGEFIDRPVKTYSSGMYARLAFAVNAFVDPEVLIVDEALAVGDAEFQKKCLERFAVLLERQCTIFFVSHDFESIRRFCNRCIYLKKGEVVCIGSPTECFALYNGMEISRESLPPDVDMRALYAYPRGQGWPVGVKFHAMELLNVDAANSMPFGTRLRIRFVIEGVSDTADFNFRIVFVDSETGNSVFMCYDQDDHSIRAGERQVHVLELDTSSLIPHRYKLYIRLSRWNNGLHYRLDNVDNCCEIHVLTTNKHLKPGCTWEPKYWGFYDAGPAVRVVEAMSR